MCSKYTINDEFVIETEMVCESESGYCRQWIEDDLEKETDLV